MTATTPITTTAPITVTAMTATAPVTTTAMTPMSLTMTATNVTQEETEL